MNEIKSKRYAGLIKQAVELHSEVDSKGWRLAEVIFDAAQELYNEGWSLKATRNGKAVGAFVQIASDVGLTQGTIDRYYYTWKKFSDPSSRDSMLTFTDHTHVTSGRRAGMFREMRAQQKAAPRGRRRNVPAVDPTRPYQRLATARSELRKVAETISQDYPDPEKAIAYVTEIHQLAVEVLTKFGGQQQAPAPGARRKVAA